MRNFLPLSVRNITICTTQKLARNLSAGTAEDINHQRGSVMKRIVLVAVALLSIGMLGCSLGNDENAGVALKVVQDYKPATSRSTLAQLVQTSVQNSEWVATKSGESLYRVVCRGTVSGQPKELVFGVNINKGDVMALNRDALAYTNPM